MPSSENGEGLSDRLTKTSSGAKIADSWSQRSERVVIRELLTHFLTKKNTNRIYGVRGVNTSLFLVDLDMGEPHQNPSELTSLEVPHFSSTTIWWCPFLECGALQSWIASQKRRKHISEFLTHYPLAIQYGYLYGQKDFVRLRFATLDSPSVWWLCQVDETIRIHTRWWNVHSSIITRLPPEKCRTHMAPNGPRLRYQSRRGWPFFL